MDKHEVAHKLETLIGEVEHIKQNAIKNGEKALEKTKEFQHSACKYVKENPGKSVAISVGVGILIGLIARR